MKGGVTCLGSVFCRRNKVKSAVIGCAIVAKKEMHENIIPDGTLKEYSVNSGKESSISLHDSYDLRSHLAAETGHLHEGKVLVVVDPSTNVAVVHETVGSHARVPENTAKNTLESASSYETVTDAASLSCNPLTKSDSPSSVSVTRSSAENGVVQDTAEFEGDEVVVSDNGEGDRRDARLSDGDVEHPLLSEDGRSEPARIEDCSSPQNKVMDNDTARYYEEFSTIVGYGSTRRNDTSYLELVNGHDSEPGLYLKCRESACSSPEINPCDAVESRSHEVLAVGEAGDRSEYELGSRIHDSISVLSGPQTTLLSYDSGSSTTGEVLNVGGFVGHGGSPKSEATYQCNADHAMFKYGASSAVLEAHKRKPWWKVFLVSHRNIHRGSLTEGDTARSSSPVNGYVSDVEERSGRSPPSTKNESVSDGHERELEKPISLLRNSHSEQDFQRQASGEKQTQESAYPSETVVSDPHLFWNGQTALSENNKPSIAVLNLDTFTEKTGLLSRVEEWVSNVPIAPSLDDEQFEPQAETVPDSPTAPVAPFFSHFYGEKSPFNDQEERHGTVRADGVLDGDQEMARMIARSVNPLSTVAHFSGVGLKVLPSLVVYTSLKTLNLSANSIVRIMPGCLPKALHKLDLSRNQIVMIEGLRELTRLRVLNLSFNRITRIGNGLSSCMSLKELYLAGNKISEVEGLHRLSKLSVLDLSFNKLTTTKSLDQIAANYKSLQALNLLGNAVQSNIGDDHMRRFVTGVCPQVLYLNKQPLKTVSNRDAVANNVARAALGKGSGDKMAAKPSKRTSSIHPFKHSSTSNHQGALLVDECHLHSGGSGGKSMSGSKGVVSPVLAADSGHHRKSHHSSRSQEKPSTLKEMRKGSVSLSQSAYIDRKGRQVERTEYPPIPRVTSDDSLFLEHSNSVLSTH